MELVQPTSSITRVAGNPSPEIEAEIFKSAETVFRNQEDVLGCVEPKLEELAKSPEELQVVELANAYTNGLLERFGLPELTIPPDNVHVVPFGEQFKTQDSAGFYHLGTQSVVLQRGLMIYHFAHRLVHEFAHFKSHNAVKVGDPDGIQEYRVGLAVADNGSLRLGLLNEAVTEEIAIEFFMRYQNHPLFKDEIKSAREFIASVQREINRQNPDLPEDVDDDLIFVFGKKNDNGEVIETLNSFGYVTEREALSELFTRLQYFNPEKFRTNKQVLNTFIDALFTGHIYELGKLIDTTFGRGTFRRIGEIDDPDELLAFVKTLQ